jgi:hypothetical protein
MVIQRGSLPRRVGGYRCTHCDNCLTMVVDLLSHPKALEHNITSLK